MQIIYAKRFRFPMIQANAIQGISMAYAFAHCDVSTHICALSQYDSCQFRSYVESSFNFLPSDQLKIDIIPHILKSAYSFYLFKQLAQLKDAIVFTRDNSTLNRVLRIMSLTGIRRPLIHEVHKIYHMDGKLSLAPGQLNKISGALFIESGLMEEAKNCHGYKRPALVAPSGFNGRIFRPVPERQADGRFVLCYWGKLIPEKGVSLLLEAMRMLPSQIHLLLVGEGGEDDKIRKMIDIIPEGTERIKIVGNVQQSQLPEILAQADAAVIPSVEEKQFLSPLKLFEALGCALPLVVTPMLHFKNLLKPDTNAFFSGEVTPQALAEATLRCMESREVCRQMRIHNAALAERYSWDARAAKIIEFVKSVI